MTICSRAAAFNGAPTYGAEHDRRVVRRGRAPPPARPGLGVPRGLTQTSLIRNTRDRQPRDRSHGAGANINWSGDGREVKRLRRSFGFSTSVRGGGFSSSSSPSSSWPTGSSSSQSATQISLRPGIYSSRSGMSCGHPRGSGSWIFRSKSFLRSSQPCRSS